MIRKHMATYGRWLKWGAVLVMVLSLFLAAAGCGSNTVYVPYSAYTESATTSATSTHIPTDRFLTYDECLALKSKVWQALLQHHDSLATTADSRIILAECLAMHLGNEEVHYNLNGAWWPLSTYSPKGRGGDLSELKKSTADNIEVFLVSYRYDTLWSGYQNSLWRQKYPNDYTFTWSIDINTGKVVPVSIAAGKLEAELMAE